MARKSLGPLIDISTKGHSGAGGGIKVKFEESGETITLPEEALEMLVTILSEMSEGKSVSIVTSDKELSTQQAAEMLKVSRPYLVNKLLKTHTLPFRKVGNHHRILLKDIIRYLELQKKARERQLDFLSEQAQELKLGYE